MSGLRDPGSLSCWCGEKGLEAFGPDYARCRRCGSLATCHALADRAAPVRDDAADFYGRSYWLDHQRAQFGRDIHERARRDLVERNLHWLEALLRRRAPGTSVLELGCGHGSFVALMQWAGYAATGVEMSPWVVDFGRRTFGIDVRTGPVEALALPAGTYDAVVMMDVLEHLPDPAGMLARCAALLKPDGALFVQMPRVPEGSSHEALVARDDPFLFMLQPEEHLFLFGEASARELFSRAGFAHQAFEPAIFAHYDMFLVASRLPLGTREPADVESSLLATPGGRFVQALRDLRERERALATRLAQADSDIVFLQDRLVKEADERAVDGERARAALRAASADSRQYADQLRELQARLAAAEADRAARLDVIEEQGRRLGKLEARAGLSESLAKELEGRLAASEADRAERGRFIEEQGRRAGEIEGERNRLRAVLAQTESNLAASEADRQARLEVIRSQGARIDEIEADLLRTKEELEAARAEAVRRTAERAALESRRWFRLGRWLGWL